MFHLVLAQAEQLRQFNVDFVELKKQEWDRSNDFGTIYFLYFIVIYS